MAVQALAVADICGLPCDEPRIRDLRVAERLGMSNPHSVRTLIAANLNEMRLHGEVSQRRRETSAKGGRPGKEYWLNEGQVLVICMLSRTPQAAQVRKEVIEVFMAYRRGLLTGEIAQAANDAPRRGRPPGLPVDLPEKARLVWGYLEPRLSAESWMPIALSDVATGSGVRYSTISTVVNALVDRKLLWRRKGPHQKAPNEYRLRVEGSTRDAPKIAAAPPAGLVGQREGYAIVQGQLIDMTPPSYRKGEQVAVRLLNGTLALHTLLEDAPIHHFVRYHRLGWVGFVGLGIGHDGHMTTEHAMIIGRVVGQALSPPVDAG